MVMNSLRNWLRSDSTPPPGDGVATPREPLRVSVTEVARNEGDFLWRTLQRLGVRPADCADVMQSVLMTVHQRAESYDPRLPLRPWLYGICVRHATAHRRKAWVRREEPTHPEELTDERVGVVAETPEHRMATQQSNQRLLSMLDELDPDKRAVLVMFEIEEISCDEIAETLGVPVGTVHSRLNAARKAFRVVLERRTARERREGR